MTWRRAAWLVLLGTACSSEADRTITAPRQFWSGHWWPLRGDLRKLYDPGDALDVYWKYLRATRSPTTDVFQPPTAAEQELAGHRCDAGCPPLAADFCGHCDAWTAASMLEPEPTTPVVKWVIRHRIRTPTGLIFAGPGLPPPAETEGPAPQPEVVVDSVRFVFNIGHQKGLLTENIYNYASVTFGSAAGGSAPAGTPAAVTAEQFHQQLEAWEQTGFALDIERGRAVWNHPVYQVKLWYRDRERRDTIRRDVDADVRYVRSIDDDFVGMRTRLVNYKYRLWIVRDTIRRAGWAGPNAPGTIWRPTRRISSGNRRVIDACVREIINRGTERIVIRNTADFRPWPCT